MQNKNPKKGPANTTKKRINKMMKWRKGKNGKKTLTRHKRLPDKIHMKFNSNNNNKVSTIIFHS